MLVVKVELWPDGNPALRRELGRAAIGNVSDLADVSDYLVVVSDSEGGWTTLVRRHLRSRGFWPLVSRALSSRTTRRIPHRLAAARDQMADVLRQGHETT